MDIEHILRTLNDHGVDYIVIAVLGEPHKPRGIGIWIEDTEANRIEVNFALQELGCQNDTGENAWKTTPASPEWLLQDNQHRLNCPHGILEIFRAVKGLGSYESFKPNASIRSMQDGELYYSLSMEDVKKASFH